MSKLPEEVDIETWLPPHRFFVKFFEVVWVEEAGKPTPKGKKQRVVFVFSDMVRRCVLCMHLCDFMVPLLPAHPRMRRRGTL